MSVVFHFDPVDLPPECEALRAEVRAFIAGELAAGLWGPNSDFGSYRSAAFSRRLGARGWIGMTWPKRHGGGERSMLERYVVTEDCRPRRAGRVALDRRPAERALIAALRHRGAASRVS